MVFDTHWLVNAGYHINCAPHFEGLYTSNELPHFIANMEYGFPGNPELGRILAEGCNALGVETLAHDATTLGPEYGTLVPMRYMNQDRHFKVVSVSALCTVHYLNDSARLAGPCARRWKSTTTARWRSSPAARCPTASPRTARRRTSPTASGARSSRFSTMKSCRCGRRAAGPSSAGCSPSTPPRAMAKASCTTPRCSLGALGWSAYDGKAEVVTPYFGSSGTGQINAVFPVTAQDGSAIPAAQAGNPAGASCASRL